MHYQKITRSIFAIALVLLLPLCSYAGKGVNNELNSVWHFRLAPETESYEAVVQSTSWRNVQIPHDWSVEHPFDSANGEGATGYLPGGIGWYSNQFNITKADSDKLYIYFDGVYNHSTYWINGHKLGYQVYGYSPFYYDITPYVKSGSNQLVVKVDRSRLVDSRWYSGSGIYREARLIRKGKLQIPIWGTFITTPKVAEDAAEVLVSVDVLNEFNTPQDFDIRVNILDAEQQIIISHTREDLTLTEEKANYSLSIPIENPSLWDIETPYLYTAEVSIIQKQKVISESSDRFGIRSIRFDAEEGFFLNGRNVKIKGVCLHHDGGLVGAAVPKGVWERRFKTLREGGCNAIRSAHNPASEEFLDLCDEMGFLVQDEFFDEWNYPKDKRLNCWERHDDYSSRGYADYFEQDAEKDLKNALLAHRNHPSIIQWSIGNEIEWAYDKDRLATGYFDTTEYFNDDFFWDKPPYTPEQIKKEYFSLPSQEYSIEETAHVLANWVRDLDTTRPVTANCILPSASLENGFTDALDVVGFSYRRILYDYTRENYPNVTVMGTENLPQWHEWKAIEERPFIAGTFLWTGIDYMGESHEQWPRKTLPSGLIDQAGFHKTAYHMYKTLWNDKPHVYICSQTADKSRYMVDSIGEIVEKGPVTWDKLRWIWSDVNEHWNYPSGEEVIIEVYSNCEEVELFLNDRSLGIKKLSDFPDRVYRWALPFAAGELRAESADANQKASYTLQTASEAAQVQASIDKTTLVADGYDVAHLEFQLCDAQGNPVKHSNQKLYIEVDGELKSLGVDNGDPANVQAYQANEIFTYNGRALLIVQATKEAGTGKVKIWGNDIPASEYTFSSTAME